MLMTIAARNSDGSITLFAAYEAKIPTKELADSQQSFHEQTGLMGPFLGIIQGGLAAKQVAQRL